MNILILSWRDLKHPDSGGAEQVIHEHAKGWVEAGHKVMLFTSSFRGSKSFEILEGIHIRRLGHELLVVHVLACIWYLFGKHPKFDLVVDNFHGIPFLTSMYVKCPKIAFVHEVAHEVWFMNHLPIPFNWLIGFIGYFVEPLIYQAYRRIQFVTISASTKNDLVGIGIPAKNIKIVSISPTLKSKKALLKKPGFTTKSDKTVMFLGTLSRDKGIEDALLTFGILNKVGDYQFWIAGKVVQGYKDHLKRLIHKYNLEEKTVFFGFVSEAKKFELLKKAHVLINPSKKEGWGLVNIEANAVGTPVVAYASTGLVDSVKKGVNGVICKVNTPASLAYEVFNLLNNKKQYESLSRKAYLWSKRFSWGQSRKMSLKLIERVGKT